MSRLAITIDGQTHEVNLVLTPQCAGQCTLQVDGAEIAVSVPNLVDPEAELNWMIINGRPYELAFDDNLRWLRSWSGLHRVEVRDLEALAPRPHSGDGRIKAPIPGLITHILVKEGEAVSADQTLLILEAMKMENEIRAPFDGQVLSLAVSVGETVGQNDLLAEIE